jgi:pimeloyl-ACP methyl ester carboxylesterase
MKQRLIYIILVVAAILVIGPFLIPLPKQPELAPEEVVLDGPLEGGRFITVDGFQTFMKDVGPRDGEVVFLIHGFGGSTFSWRETLPALANNNYRAVAVDLKGFGLSTKVFDSDFSHQAQADFVAGIMDTLNIERVTIIGHSMGANVTAHFFLAYPERVDKLVIVDGAIATQENGAAGFGASGWLVHIPQVRRLARITARAVLSEDQIQEMLESAVFDPEFVTPAMTKGYYTPLTIKDWELALLGIVRDARKNTLPQPLNTIKAPTLIIWGEHDTWVSPENGERLLGELPNAELVTVTESGHLPMEEQPEYFNSLLLTFLEKGTFQEEG